VTLIPMGAARLRLTSFPVIGSGADAHDWVPIVRPPYDISASNVNDDLDAMADLSNPSTSIDGALRFTWWDHRGTAEWTEYDYKTPKQFSSTMVYWFDDTGNGGQCRPPKSWRLTYKDGDSWKPVVATGPFGVAINTFNKVTFAPVTTTALRVEVQLQDNFSGGILRWRNGS
jgi:hypothetical protein